jgi:hypothetical protein
MSQNYRVHYRKGDVDIEVESTDKTYVNEMLNKLLETTPVPARKQEGRSAQRKQARSKAKDVTGERGSKLPSIDVPGIVAKIHEADNFGDIEKHILNKSAQLPRILLVCHFAHERGHEWVTTGDIESLTDELGTKISTTNVGHTISANRKYFTAGKVRKRGAIVPYKINRLGKLALDKYIAPEKS